MNQPMVSPSLQVHLSRIVRRRSDTDLEFCARHVRSRRLRRGRAHVGFVMLAVFATISATASPWWRMSCFARNFAGLQTARPNRTAVTVGPVEIDLAIQDADHWRMSLAESNQGDQPIAIVSKPDGGPILYSVNYDSKLSQLKLPSNVEHFALTVAGNDVNLSDLVWTFQAKGEKGGGLQDLSFASDGGTVAYDVSLSYDVKPRDDLSIHFASDFHKIANQLAPKLDLLTGDVSIDALRPDSMRHGVGLGYKSKRGELKARVAQTDPFRKPRGLSDMLDVSAEYKYKIKGVKTLLVPEALLRAVVINGRPAYGATISLSKSDRVVGSLDFEVEDNIPKVSGSGDVQLSKQVLPGITVHAGTQMSVSQALQKAPDSTDAKLAPVTLGVAGDLKSIFPRLAKPGSEVEAHVTYPVGADRPSSTGASLSFKTTPKRGTSMDLVAKGAMDAAGAFSGDVELRSSVDKLDVRYDASSKGNKHFAEVTYTPNKGLKEQLTTLSRLVELPTADLSPLQGIDTAYFARVTKSDTDFDGKPRLQIGFQYDFNKDVRVRGEDILFDTGKLGGSRLDANGESLQHAEHETMGAKVSSNDNAPQHIRKGKGAMS